MQEKNNNEVSLPVAVITLLALTGVGFLISTKGDAYKGTLKRNSESAEKVTSLGGTAIQVRLGNLGPELVSSGTIDREKFIRLYEGNPAMKKEAERLLDGKVAGNLVMTEENAPIVLNFLWALGLANKNPVLDEGPMKDPRFGGAGNFASTGGWTIAKGNAMDHYSLHSMIVLTEEQQDLVERVAKTIYRPCCDNSTYFPDCNHGMAMLGLLELLASQGANEEEMYKAALIANSYWFPGTYEAIAQYAKEKNVNISPQEMLGVSYSSSSGFRNIVSQITKPGQQQGGSGCGVGGVPQVAPQRQQSDCGVGGVPQVIPQQRQQSGCGV